jgi:hypothetical protein
VGIVRSRTKGHGVTHGDIGKSNAKGAALAGGSASLASEIDV